MPNADCCNITRGGVVSRRKTGDLRETAEEFARELKGNRRDYHRQKLAENFATVLTAKDQILEAEERDLNFLKCFLNRSAIVVKVNANWIIVILRDFFEKFNKEEMELIQRVVRENERLNYQPELLKFLQTVG